MIFGGNRTFSQSMMTVKQSQDSGYKPAQSTVKIPIPN